MARQKKNFGPARHVAHFGPRAAPGTSRAWHGSSDAASSLPAPGAGVSLNATLFHRNKLAIRELHRPPSRCLPPPPSVSILFPDWEAFLLLPLPSAAATDHRYLSCLFHNGAVSPAHFIGIIPTSPARSAFRCPIPTSICRRRQFRSPRLINPPTAAPESDGHDPHSKMIQWTCLAYEAVFTSTDVIVFAKGVNSRQGVNRPASDLRCLFSSSAGCVAATLVTSSAQEVLHCPHPPATAIPVESRTGEPCWHGPGSCGPCRAGTGPSRAVPVQAHHGPCRAGTGPSRAVPCRHRPITGRAMPGRRAGFNGPCPA